MKTQNMQKRLEDLSAAGKIESGCIYDIMPSDCRGDGYDIAMRSRGDESGDYEVGGNLMRITCTVRVGSRNWCKGIPAGYRLECNPAIPYVLRPGERAIVCERIGNKIGRSGYMSRTLASLAIVREDGSKIYRGHSPYWIASTNTYASHYVSGRNRADEAAYQSELEQLQRDCDEINANAAIVVAA